MSEQAWVGLIGGVLGAFITAMFAYLVARTNARATSTANTIPPYEQLVNRLTKLEAKDEERDQILDRMRERMAIIIADRDALVSYVKQWANWALSGAVPPPPPVPAHLRDLLDPDEWEVAHVTERTTTTTYVHPPAVEKGGTDNE